jgi:hypothetical protein
MLYHLLDSIKHNPALFLNQQSVTDLHTFLLGWQTAKNVYKLPQEQDQDDFDYFQEWIAQRYKIETNQPWPKVITFFSMDDKGSLELFFKLLNEYRQRPSQQRMRGEVKEELALEMTSNSGSPPPS